MFIMFFESSHAIYSLTRWLYVYIILGSAFLRISGQLAFDVSAGYSCICSEKIEDEKEAQDASIYISLHY